MASPLYLIFIYLLGAIGGCGVAFVALVVTFDLVAISHGITWSLSQRVAISAGLLSVPLASQLAGYFLSTFATEGKAFSFPSFRALLFCAAFALLLPMDYLLMGFESYISVLQKASFSSAEWLVLIQHFFSKIIVVGGLIAFVYMSLSLCIELPMRWALRSGRVSIGAELVAIRQLGILLFVALSFQLASAFVMHELGSNRIF